MMFGGEEWDFLGPVHVGDEITGTTRLADLDQKKEEGTICTARSGNYLY